MRGSDAARTLGTGMRQVVESLLERAIAKCFLSICCSVDEPWWTERSVSTTVVLLDSVPFSAYCAESDVVEEMEAFHDQLHERPWEIYQPFH